MKLYAELPTHRVRQAAADLVLICWVAAAVWCGRLIHGRLVESADAARSLQHGGHDVATNMTEAGKRLSRIPLIGDKVRAPFDKAAAAGREIGGAGKDAVTGLDDLGLLLGVLTSGLLILTACVVWGSCRLPRLRRMTRAARLRPHPGGRRALALQAMADGHVVDPSASSLDDPATVHALADAHLAALGLRPVRPVPDS